MQEPASEGCMTLARTVSLRAASRLPVKPWQNAALALTDREMSPPADAPLPADNADITEFGTPDTRISETLAGCRGVVIGIGRA